MAKQDLKTLEEDLCQHAWDFVDPPPNDYICSECGNVLRKPVLTECCGSNFCEACIEPLPGWVQECPKCKEIDFASILDKKKWTKILELDVKCPLSHRGCLWTGELGERAAHLDLVTGDCDYIDVECTFGCGESLEKIELAEHLEIFCPKRQATCPHCSVTGEHEIINGKHKDECPELPVHCPNTCGAESIKQALLKQHLEVCPEQQVECPFSYAGCKEELRRKDLEKHLQDNSQEHLISVPKFFLKELEKKDELLRKLAENRDKRLEILSQIHHQQLAKFAEAKEEQMKKLVEDNEREIKKLATEKDEQMEQIWKVKYKLLESNIRMVSGQQWEINRQELELTNMLEAGQNKTEIWEGRFKGEQVAIKKLQPGAPSSQLLNELGILANLQHANIIKLLGSCTKSEPLYLVLEFMSNGNLLDYMKKNGGAMTLAKEMSFMRSIASGLAYLEEHSCLHQRIRARNMLIGNGRVCKVSGLASAVMLGSPTEEYPIPKDDKVPIRWSAPEVHLENKATLKSDVWSFGILLYEIITHGRVPYPNYSNVKVVEHMKRERGIVMPIPLGCPQKLYDNIILYCWKRDPQSRLTFAALSDQLNNTFLRDLHPYSLID